MKINDSGMPDESYWNSLFDVPAILRWMDCAGKQQTVVEVGCGYGTFTLPVASAIQGLLLAFDIEQTMLNITRKNADAAGLDNIDLNLRDVLSEGTGLPDSSVDRVMLFNIMHFPEPRQLLQECVRILKPNGQVNILHWRKDIPTPRGPKVETRPDTTAIVEAISGMDLQIKVPGLILPPYHWGLSLYKTV